MSGVAVLIPWGGEDPHRKAALVWTMARYIEALDSVEIVLGFSPDGPFNRAAAILDAARRTSADTLVVSDGDVFCDPTEALANVGQAGWAIPHNLVHRLSRESTSVVLAGADWHGLPLSTDNRQDRRPYKGSETGTLFVIRRDVLSAVPPDGRFVGWGQEDNAHAFALRTLVGKPWRGDADLVHLWHPPQPRQSRYVGNNDSLALMKRYRSAYMKPERMRALIEEVPAWQRSVSKPTAAGSADS